MGERRDDNAVPAADRPPAVDPDLTVAELAALNDLFLGPTLYRRLDEFRAAFPDRPMVTAIERRRHGSGRVQGRARGSWPTGSRPRST